MLFQAKNGVIRTQTMQMDYIRFGSGTRVLILLPGLGDGLRTVKGTALPMAWMYKKFAADYTVYVFSRQDALPQGHSTRDMAKDQMEAMDALGITQADVVGVSMGGMIAQHLAIDYPDAVRKLVLTVTTPGTDSVLADSVTLWMEQAKRGDHTALMASNLERLYSEAYIRQNRWMVPILGKLTKPKSYDRFLIQCNACLTHNAYACVSQIRCPTLVIGGELDHALHPDSSRTLARLIPGAELHMYPDHGHSLYEEATDFADVLLAFLAP